MNNCISSFAETSVRRREENVKIGGEIHLQGLHINIKIVAPITRIGGLLSSTLSCQFGKLGKLILDLRSERSHKGISFEDCCLTRVCGSDHTDVL